MGTSDNLILTNSCYIARTAFHGAMSLPLQIRSTNASYYYGTVSRAGAQVPTQLYGAPSLFGFLCSCFGVTIEAKRASRRVCIRGTQGSACG